MGLIADIGKVLIKLGEPSSNTIPNEEIEKIIKLLKFIAEGGLYGGIVAIFSIGLASFYAGWFGMTVVMFIFGFLFIIFGNKQLSRVLNEAGSRKRKTWEVYLLGLGFLLIAIAIMGFLDQYPIQIPRPRPDPYWLGEGIVGFILTVASLLYIRFGRK